MEFEPEIQDDPDLAAELQLEYDDWMKKMLSSPDGDRECDIEFGPHEHDDVECARMLDEMKGDPYFDWETESYNREAEENMLGRPLFPNEY